MTIKINPDNEEWRPVPGFVGLYEVSSLGRLRSLRLLSTAPGSNGYPRAVLYAGGERTMVAVHTLVAAAFIGPRPDGQQVRHLDGSRDNCAVENLAYGTRVENAQDARQHGSIWNSNKTHCPQGHPYEGDNLGVHTRADGTPYGRFCRICSRARVAAHVRPHRWCPCTHRRQRHRPVPSPASPQRGVHLGACRDCDCEAFGSDQEAKSA